MAMAVRYRLGLKLVLRAAAARACELTTRWARMHLRFPSPPSPPSLPPLGARCDYSGGKEGRLLSLGAAGTDDVACHVAYPDGVADDVDVTSHVDGPVLMHAPLRVGEKCDGFSLGGGVRKGSVILRLPLSHTLSSWGGGEGRGGGRVVARIAAALKSESMAAFHADVVEEMQPDAVALACIVWMRTHAHAHAHTHRHRHTHTDTHRHTHTHSHTYTHIHTHSRTKVCGACKP